MTEWEFTADVASSINELLTKNPELPFSQARCEQRGEGSKKRRDLTLLDRDKCVILTGEVKLPFAADGGSPYNEALVLDARSKAQKAQARYFFTWNVNECVLWETFPPKTQRVDRNYRSWSVVEVHKPSHLEIPSIQHRIDSWLATFLYDVAAILRGTSPLGLRSPDQKFVDALESALKLPILFTLEHLEKEYTKPRFKSELDKWMREEQGWIIYDDREGILENLERASKFAAYALVNKLVFHEALLKRYKRRLLRLDLPEHIASGDALRTHLEKHFADAIRVTGDYETVFGEDHTSIGNRIPFYSSQAVPHWRQLIEQIHVFDFSKLDYEIIGSIFESLISPEERHKYGQYYTRPEVVDLINSFCIRTGEESVMDPACGGGTFLVRAYARKRELARGRKHAELLADLYGIDVSHFASHLTTINLATRDLIDDDNYPQIVRSDFFDIDAEKPFMQLPRKSATKLKTSGMGKVQHRSIMIPALDAVIGNPPYIRQEEIPKEKRNGKNGDGGTKDYYRRLVRAEANAHLSGRSDIHCYFWPHAFTFLRDEGYLCFLTSSQWLDVEYGFRLQDWILRHFEIVAVFESIEEPWFVGARVATTVTILRKQADESKRMKNVARFVQLRRPIAELLANDGSTIGAIKAADDLRDEILRLKQDSLNERFRAKLVVQGDLWCQGVDLGVMMEKSDEEGTDGNEQHGEYYGGKWGAYLRGPDIWFDFLKKYGGKLAPLGKIARIWRGITTGKDDFFYLLDCTDEILARDQTEFDLDTQHGVSRKEIESGKVRLLRCGEGHGEVRPIEAKYLEPEIHSLMEVRNFSVSRENCSRQILLVSEKKDRLRDRHVKQYIEWGEKQGWHQNATCAARVTPEREWYDLTGHQRAPILWPKERQYRHIAPINNERLIANCRMYEILPHIFPDDALLWGGILNSSWVLMSSLQFGRPVGNEGNWSTMVVDVNMMLVPDPSRATMDQRDRVAKAFAKLSERAPIQFLSERRMRQFSYLQSGRDKELQKLSIRSEIESPDRLDLDDAVLELMGVSSKKERKRLLRDLYAYLAEFFERTRQKEEKAIINKASARRRGQSKPNEIAEQIYDEIRDSEAGLIKPYDPGFLDRSKPYDTFDLPAEGQAVLHESLFDKHGVAFVKGKKSVGIVNTVVAAQDPLVVLVAETGLRGLRRFPHQESECRRVLAEYEKFVRHREQRLWELIEARTVDEEMQKKIYEVLCVLILQDG